MRFICLGYHDETTWVALPVNQRQALIEETLAYRDALRSSGHFLEGKALQPTVSAATLRFDGRTVTVTDGPFAETKEQLGGFTLLEARDLNHAIQLMSSLPCMRVGGSMEIRPLNEQLSG